MSQRAFAVFAIILVVALLGAFSQRHLPGQPTGASWAEKSAQITTEEFLALFFRSEFHEDDGRNSLNDGNLVMFVSANSPSQAIVLINQYYDLRQHTAAEADVRREVRKVANSMLGLFESDAKSPVVRKRWKISDPKNALIIRHMPEDDMKETIAVTVNGETSFEMDDFKKAENLVKSRGGYWPK
jgi:hypothetical protein